MPYLASKFIGQLFYNKEQYDSTIFYYRVALGQLEMTDSLFRLKMDQNVQLSRGEQEILPMIAEGLTSKDIAKRLFVTEQTIKWRRQRLLAKFDARNTAEMLSKAREIGLL